MDITVQQHAVASADRWPIDTGWAVAQQAPDSDPSVAAGEQHASLAESLSTNSIDEATGTDTAAHVDNSLSVG